MIRKTLKTGPFRRIGDAYGRFIDSEHFMGRDAFQDTWIAPANVSKMKDHLHIEVPLPGYTKEEVKVEVAGDRLQIEAEKKEEDRKEYLQQEIPILVSKQLLLTESVDSDKIQTRLENGMLDVTIPCKKKAKANSVQKR